MRQVLTLLTLTHTLICGVTYAQTTSLSLDGHEVEHMMVFFDTGQVEVQTPVLETYHEVLHQLEHICSEDHDRIAAEVMQVASNPDMMLNHLELMQELRATLPNTPDSNANCTEKLTLILQVCTGRSQCFHLSIND